MTSTEHVSDHVGFESSNPVVRLTLSLADYAVRRLAPVVLGRVAAEIEASGCPVQEGAPSADWRSLAAIVASFRRTARELADTDPLTPQTADRAYKALDNVRTGIDWVEWPGGNRRDDLHQLVIDAMMPAAHAQAAGQRAQEDLQEWQDRYDEPLTAALTELLGLAVRDVRTTCQVLERSGVHAHDLAAFTEDPAAQPQD